MLSNSSSQPIIPLIYYKFKF